MPHRSSSSPADIGLSKSEYEEAVNLEKLYFLANKNDRCAICGRGGVAGVDVSRYEFLCASCSSGKSSFKRIGEDRFSSFEVNKLYARFDSCVAGERSCEDRRPAWTEDLRLLMKTVLNISKERDSSSRRSSKRGQSRSPPPRDSGRRVPRESRRPLRRQPSPIYSESESDDDEEPPPPPPRRSHSMPRGGDSGGGRLKQQRHHQRQSGDPFEHIDSSGGGGWGGQMMLQGMQRAGGEPDDGGAAPKTISTGLGGGGGGMGMMPPAAAGMLGLGMQQSQQQPGLAGMMGGGAGLGGGQGVLSAGLLQQQQPPWGCGGAAAGSAGLQQQQLLQQQLLRQQQQLLLLRQQQQIAAAAAGRDLGGGILAGANPATGLPLGARGSAGGMLTMGMQRPPAFAAAGGGGVLPQQQQQQLQSPFLSLQQPQHSLTAPHSASSNPFLSMQPQPGLGSSPDAANFASFQQPGAGFQQQQLLPQQPGARPLGAPPAPVMGGQPSLNPFMNLGAAQRPSTPMLANASRFGGTGGAGGDATGGGNVYNSSLW